MNKSTLESAITSRLLSIKRKYGDGHRLKLNLINKPQSNVNVEELTYKEGVFIFTTWIELINTNYNKDYDLIFDKSESNGDLYYLDPNKEYNHYWIKLM